MPAPITQVEYQISATSFLTAFTEQIKKAPIPIVGPFPGPDDQNIYVDHTVFGTAELRQTLPQVYDIIEYVNFTDEKTTVSGLKLQVVQNVAFFLVTETSLRAAGTNPATDLIEIDAKLVIGVSVSLDGTGAVQSCYSFDELQTSGLPPTVASAIGAVSAKIGQQVVGCKPLDFLKSKSVSTYFDPRSFKNVGIIADRSLQFLVIRLISSDADYAVPMWEQFFNGNVANELLGKQWALYVNKYVIENAVYNLISTQANANPTTYSMQGGVDSSWSDRSDGTLYNAHAIIVVYDGCAGVGDFHVNVNVFADFTAKAQALHTDLRLNVSADGWDDEICGALTGLLWPIIGVALVAGGKLELTDVAVGLAQPFRALDEVILPLFKSKVQIPPQPDCQEVSPTELVCDSPFQGLELVTGTSTHLVYAGTKTGAVASGPKMSLDVASGFGLSIPPVFGCNGQENARIGQDILNHPANYIQGAASISVESTGDIPLQINDFSVIEDTLGVFKITVQKTSSTLTIGAIQFSASGSPIYLDDPYPCVVRLQTSAGDRIVSIPGPEMPDSETLQRLIENSQSVSVEICGALISQIVAPFTIKWLVDPPIDPVGQGISEIVVRGIDPGLILELSSADRTVLGSAVADLTGAVHLTALSNKETLSLSRGAAMGSPLAPGRLGTRIAITQSNVSIGEKIPMQRGTIDIALDVFASRPALFVRNEAGITAYDIGNLTNPEVVLEYPDNGIAGMLATNSLLLIWGENGLVVLQQGRTIKGEPYCDDEYRIGGIGTYAGYYYMLSGDSVVVLNRRFGEVRRLHIEGQRLLAVLDGSMITANDEEISFFDLSEPLDPCKQGCFAVPSVQTISKRSAILRPRTLFVTTKERPSGFLINFRDLKCVEILQNSWSNLDYLTTERMGLTLAHRNVNEEVIELMTIGTSVSFQLGTAQSTS